VHEDVAGKQDALVWQPDRRIVRRIGRTAILYLDPHSLEIEVEAVVEQPVRRHDLE
jgi:hypothetical protein